VFNGTDLRNWVKAFAGDPQHAFPGQGQMKPEQVWDNAAMESFFSSQKTERTTRNNVPVEG
jgi:transposase